MILCFHGDPRTKKNSQQIRTNGVRRWIAPSSQYEQYEAECLWQIPNNLKLSLDIPVNVKCVYYMQTRRRVDLCNLIEATCDILVKGGVIKDDCASIVAGHDGSRVLYNKGNPRVEIYIEVIR